MTEHIVHGEMCKNPDCWCNNTTYTKGLDEIIDEWQNNIDMVNEPAHYKLCGGAVEAMDIIKDVLSTNEYRGYLRGTLLAYHLRANRKNGEEDLRKAYVYSKELEKLLDEST